MINKSTKCDTVLIGGFALMIFAIIVFIKPAISETAAVAGFILILFVTLKIYGRHVVSQYEKHQGKTFIKKSSFRAYTIKAVLAGTIAITSVMTQPQPVYAQTLTQTGKSVITFDTGFPDYQIGSMSYVDRHTLLPVPVYEGYIFEGWYNEGEPFSKDSLTFSSAYGPAEDIRLKAKWIKTTGDSDIFPSMTICFDAECHKIYNSIRIPCGTEPEDPFPVPEYPGHVFKGWFADGTEYTEKDIAIAPVEDGTITLKAKWEEDTPVNQHTEKITTPDQTDEQIKASSVTETFSNGTRVITTIYDTVIENHVVSSRLEKQLFYTDGDVKKETSYIYYGYQDYMNSHSEDELTIEVMDASKRPIEGVCVEFHAGGRSRAVYTDACGMAAIKIEKELGHDTEEDSEFYTEIRTLPPGYHIESESPMLGYGCMYSVIYRKRYILSDKKDVTKESSNISGTLVLD